jgi:MFS family permease
MNASTPTVYPARWGVLLTYALAALVLQLQWLTFAPIARTATLALGVEQFDIDLLSLVFMGVFVVACIPASWFLDRFGLRAGVGLGALFLGVFGLMKGLVADNYTLLVVAQLGLALSQPLIINAATKLAAQWFPIAERATAVGIATLSQFIGIIVVMMVTPALVDVDATRQAAAALVDATAARPDLGPMLMIYGAISAAVAVLVLLVLREKPPTPPSAEPTGERLMTFAGIRHMLGLRDMRLVMGLYFVGLGVFNAVSTCIDLLCAKNNLNVDETGLVGGLMFITGIIGAAILAPMSDKMRKRKPFLVLAMALTTVALALLALADGFLLLVIGSGVLGFFLLGAGAPVGFQYAAEVSYPTAESMSQGIILLTGQISGILFIVGINVLGMGPFMWLFVGLAALATLFAVLLRESPRLQP